MSFGFRKSFSSGPLRVTLSKRGLSTSFGAGGARLTSGPRGAYVTFSKGGFYYRQRINPPAKNRSVHETTPAQPEPVAPPSLPNDTPKQPDTPIPSPEIFGDIAPDEVVQAINRRMSRRNYSLPVGIAVSAAFAAFFYARGLLDTPWTVAVLLGPTLAVLLNLQHRKSKYSALHYEEATETLTRLEGLHKAVSSLRSCSSVWAIREASLALGLTPHPATLSRTRVACEPTPLPQYLKTNITPAALQLSDATLYFFPDRLFIWHSGRFSAVNYREIKLRFSSVRFLERELQPLDALAESSLRRSFADETRIPILRYGSVEFDAAPALQFRLMTSRPESAQEFIRQLRSITGDAETEEPDKGGIAPLYTHFDSKRLPLFYDLAEKDIRKLQAARDAFASVAQCDYVWRYEGVQNIDDWKRNAGAGKLVTRSRVTPGLVDGAPEIESNALVGLSIGSATLYLLPDGWVINSGNAYHVAGNNLSVNISAINFRDEDAAPRDGQVIGKTWRYVNKNGGPDRRFNDNRRIPIYLYGQIFMSCGDWRMNLCLSRADAANQFAAALRGAWNQGSEDSRRNGGDIPPRLNTKPEIPTPAFRLLGLEPGASFEDASAAYRNLAAQNHPDKVAQMAPEFRELAERKMRELNAAYDQIRVWYQQRG